MKAKVHVFLKPGVLDVEGKAIEGALHGLGWRDVANVRVGKTIEFEAKAPTAPSWNRKPRPWPRSCSQTP